LSVSDFQHKVVLNFPLMGNLFPNSGNYFVLFGVFFAMDKSIAGPNLITMIIV